MKTKSASRGWGYILVGLFVALFLFPSMAYIVNETEQAVVLQFGKPVAERTKPGLYFKLPFVHEVRKLPSTKQFWGDDLSSALPDLPTKDDKKIEVIPWAIWRINHPQKFVQRLRTIENAEDQVTTFARGAIRDFVTQYELAELVRSTNRALITSASQVGAEAVEDLEKLADTGVETREVRMDIRYGRPLILEKIEEACSAKLAAVDSGIELVDVGISQIEFVESVRKKTFDRWIAERQAVSAKNTNDGERMKQEMINKAEAEVEKIVGEGQQLSNQLRGDVDAEIITKYATAMNEVGEFYTFVRTLEAYENSVKQDTRLILTTDSEFMRLLKEMPPSK